MVGAPILLAFVIVLACAAVGRWLFKKDTEIEQRRRAASRLAGILRAKGMEHLPEFLEEYAVGDYSGMGKMIHKAALMLENPAVAEKMFDDMVDRAIAARAAKEAPAA